MVKKGEAVTIEAAIMEQSKREVSFRRVAMLEDKEIARAIHTRTLISKKIVTRMIGEA